MLPPRVTTLVVAPPVPPIFGRSALRQDPELGDRIDGNLHGEPAVHAVHVLRAVHQIDVLLRTHAVDGVGLTLAQRPSGRRDAASQRRDAGLQQAELREVSAVQRQVDELASGDDTSQRIGRRVDELHAAGDGDDVVTEDSSNCTLSRTVWLTVTGTRSCTAVENFGASTVTLCTPRPAGATV